MRKHTPLHRWDDAVAAYLRNRRALGRRYAGDERMLAQATCFPRPKRCTATSTPHFDAWRRQFAIAAITHGSTTAMIVYRVLPLPAPPRASVLPARSALARAPQTVPTARRRSSASRSRRCSSTSSACLALAPIDLRATASCVSRSCCCSRPAFAAARSPGSPLERCRCRAPASCASALPSSTSHAGCPVHVRHRELRTYLAAAACSRSRTRPPPIGCCAAAARPGLHARTLSAAVKSVMRRSGMWADAPRLPRVHDFRHGFAVAALRRWYEDGADVQSELPKLALYMGHVSIVSTAYYLRYMPAVVALASQRFAPRIRRAHRWRCVMSRANPDRSRPRPRAFFEDFLPVQRGLSPHTIRSYRDALLLFLQFAARDARRPIERLDVADLTAERITRFLRFWKPSGTTASPRAMRGSAPFTSSRGSWRPAARSTSDPCSASSACRSSAARWRRRSSTSIATEIEALLNSIDRSTAPGAATMRCSP